MDAGEAVVLRIMWHFEGAVKHTRRKHSAFYFRSASSEAASDRSKPVFLPHLYMKGANMLHQLGPAYKVPLLRNVSIDLIDQ